VGGMPQWNFPSHPGQEAIGFWRLNFNRWQNQQDRSRWKGRQREKTIASAPGESQGRRREKKGHVGTQGPRQLKQLLISQSPWKKSLETEEGRPGVRGTSSQPRCQGNSLLQMDPDTLPYPTLLEKPLCRTIDRFSSGGPMGGPSVSKEIPDDAPSRVMVSPNSREAKRVSNW